MARFTSIASIALSLCGLFIISHAWEHLSELELESVVNNNDGAAVVAFINPSDKRSENLEIEWSLVIPGAQLPFVSVDCEANPGLCASYGMSSYPILKMLKQGKVESTYNGPRRAFAILAWVDRVQRPVVSEVSTAALEDFKKADSTTFIAYLDAGDEVSKSAFAGVAERYREEFTFGMATDEATLTAEKAAAPVVRCYKHLDDDEHELTSVSDTEALERFVKEASRPIIGELLPHNHQRFLDRGWSMVYVFAATEAERSHIRSDLKKMARGYYETLTMVTVDPLEFPDLPAKLGLDPSVLPAGAVHQLSKDRIYPYPRGRGWTSNELQTWGLDVWQGRIRPWTPPGVTTAYEDLGGRIKATQRVSMRNIPGVKIKIGGRDEL
ncbi:thioredoxin-like domain-containing protein [Hypoxylon sp. NC1633]|nr:thioredoxin-like domain-containing protein [Hypoxylon sp. NC1633]